jgi:predicted permease
MRIALQELRAGWRVLKTAPGYAALAVITLTLGIGASGAVLGATRSLVWAPYPYRDASRILVFQIRDLQTARPGGRAWYTGDEFAELQANVNAIHQMIGVVAGRETLLTTSDSTERWMTVAVTGNAFAFLGVPPLAGRGLVADDAAPGADAVFVMSHRLWSSRFGADPLIVGRTFVLDGAPKTLVGVMPPRFALQGADIWEPVTVSRTNPGRFFYLRARLAPGVTASAAEEEFQRTLIQLAQRRPELYPKRFGVEAVSLIDSVAGPLRARLYTLGAAGLMLLFIAAGNVANLMLLRTASRVRELAVRRALGATGARVFGHVAAEAVVICWLAAIVGLALAHLGLALLGRLIPEGLLVPEAELRVDAVTLMAGVLVATVTAILCGAVAALAVRRGGWSTLGDSRVGRVQTSRTSRVLIVLQVALSMMLMAATGLLARTWTNLTTADLGVEANAVQFVRLRLPAARTATAAAKQELVDVIVQRVRAVPGVIASAAATAIPFDGGIRTAIAVPGRTDEAAASALVQMTTSDYIDTVGLRLTDGRAFTAADVTDARRVGIVSETFARQYLGQQARIGVSVIVKALAAELKSPQAATFEVIGVVADSRNRGVQSPPLPEIFVPASISGAYGRVLLVRMADGQPSGPVGRQVVHEIKNAAPGVVVTDAGPLVSYLDRFSFAEPRLALVVMSGFTTVSLAPRPWRLWRGFVQRDAAAS